MNHYKFVGVAVALLLACGSLHAHDPLLLYFIDRPPYMVKHDDGSLTGSTATPVLRAFERAGIAYELHQASAARQIKDVKDNQKRVCLMGWYKTAERSKFSKFSKPISYDSNMIGLAPVAFRPPVGTSVATILADPKVTVLRKVTVSYGPYLERQFATMRAKAVTTEAEFPQLVRMIQSGRANLAFFTMEEVTYHLQQAGYAQTDFNVIQFPDMPQGEGRHLMCSQRVEDTTLARLNEAIGK